MVHGIGILLLLLLLLLLLITTQANFPFAI
jgi:hypothetical protein